MRQRNYNLLVRKEKVLDKTDEEEKYMEYVSLSNGVKMPILGYGVYQVTKDECKKCVLDALKAG